LSEQAARLFRLLSVHPGPDITAAAAASLAGIPAADTRPLLAELTGMHLISQHIAGRFTFHDLLRVYAAERARACRDGRENRAAQHRMLDHYLHSARAAAELANPDWRWPAGAPPLAGVTPESPSDSPHAWAWFSAEHKVLMAVTRSAGDVHADKHAAMLPT